MTPRTRRFIYYIKPRTSVFTIELFINVAIFFDLIHVVACRFENKIYKADIEKMHERKFKNIANISLGCR